NSPASGRRHNISAQHWPCAALLIAVDTNAKEGRGLIGLNKGRDGGEGEVAEIIYLPQIGVVKQPEMGAGAADVFEF
ncbi:hypothetical protein, partial [Sphingobium sp.]|uniref:hypothetical protein n=1 Tax=Sphingobium sp. TaxID=1912891 RepID=UPI0035C73AD3